MVFRLVQPTLVFLFFTVFCALMLHASRLPLWLLVFSGVALVWRGLMFRSVLPKPNWFVKLLLVVGGFSGIYFSYGVALTIESMVSLLIAGIMLKPLEVESNGDSYLLIFLNYFLCSLLFLFDQTPLDFILSVLVILFTLASQVLVHFYGVPSKSKSIKVAAGIFLKSIPLAVFLFFVLPRIGPLWTLNIPTQSGVVGLSDSMSPGSIASLGKTNELAFRVKLLEGQLSQSERYFRAFTLSNFDGERWERSPNLQMIDRDFSSLNETNLSYQITLEPHEKNWLFSVGAPEKQNGQIEIQHDASILSRRKIYSPWQYRVSSSSTPWIYQSGLTRTENHQYLLLPKNINPKTLEFSKVLGAQSNSNVMVFLSLFKSYIVSNDFTYTLEPGVYNGDHQVDDFLFESKQGFCSYYAGALAVSLRAAGYPSRIVTGYLGGEDNPLSNTISVYQYDAHAWVEVWVEDSGWLRVDPTAWASPERIESGLQQAIPNQFAGFNSNYQWLRDLRRRLQALDYYWNDWMLSYKGGQQQAFLKDILGDRTSYELAGILVLVLLGLLSGLFVFIWLDQKQIAKSGEEKLFNLLRNHLDESHGSHLKSITFSQLINHLIEQHPLLSEELEQLKSDIHSSLYKESNSSIKPKQYRLFKQQIKALNKKMHAIKSN